jgi:ribonucleotide reductase beta subunit family protein with ferritin-like domain
MFSEGLFFQFSFLTIFWLKSLGLLPGVQLGNDMINWDETQHINTAVVMIFQILRQYGIDISAYTDKINKFARESSQLCFNYVQRFMVKEFNGFTKILVMEHLQFCVNLRVTSLKQAPLFYQPDGQPIGESPFKFMNSTHLEGKTNFFEKKVPEYSKSGVLPDYISGKAFTGNYTQNEKNFIFGESTTTPRAV